MLPPPIQGLGNGSGYSFFIEDRGHLGYGALQSAVQAFQGAGLQTPGLGYMNTSYQAKIGRASCRERVCQYVWISVVSVSFKTKIGGMTMTQCMNRQDMH